MSLRWFHMVFLLLVIMGAELFGFWALWTPRYDAHGWMPVLGVTTLLGGLGLAAYVCWLVRKMERAGLR